MPVSSVFTNIKLKTSLKFNFKDPLKMVIIICGQLPLADERLSTCFFLYTLTLGSLPHCEEKSMSQDGQIMTLADNFTNEDGGPPRYT